MEMYTITAMNLYIGQYDVAKLGLQARRIVAGNLALHTILLQMLIMSSSLPSSGDLLSGVEEEWGRPANRPDPSQYTLNERGGNGTLQYDVDSLQMDWVTYTADLKDHYEKEVASLKRKVKEKDRALNTMNRKMEEEKRRAAANALTTAGQLEQHDPAVWDKVYEFGKKTGFCTHKFITRKEKLNNYNLEGSLGDMALKHFRVPMERKSTWWNMYKSAMEEAIAYQRQAAQTLVGKRFRGE